MNFNPKLIEEDFAIPARIAVPIIALIISVGGALLWFAG